ncbi:MAG: hypothetical protein CMN87_20385 [Stappia sp.]|uniref:DUF2336 domain-containing protein n=1 Tax=Stappia sp. TaxID=1870903 RepID=UPI000C6B72CE|nr:DUF2336 domain-containing protein [Stappia sp.]MAA98011.1 hypothetical protein [Stappia sp.]MBM22366.1 hypothetical protein [Stappia sp.]
MSNLPNTELVNFEALANEKDMTRRNELARNVATLFSLTSESCSDEQIEIYDSVLVRLSDMVETQARAFISDRLASLRRAPEATIRRLASDEIAVARPVLEKSTVLRDADLVEIASGHGDEHRIAIATREILSEIVTDVLVERGSTDVHRKVAGNGGANLSERAITSLLEVAGVDEDLQMALAKRGDLDETTVETLAGLASERVRMQLLSNAGANTDKVPDAARVAAQKLSNDFWLHRYDFETAMGRVYAIARGPGISEETLLRFAEEDRFAEVVGTFALLGDIGLEEAKHWMVRVDTDPFLIVARACELSSETVGKVLTVGPWRYLLNDALRAKAVARFEAINPLSARKLLSDWHGRLAC